MEGTFPSPDELRSITETFDAMTIMDEHDIDATGLNSFEELKQRLLLEWSRRQGILPKHKIGTAIYDAGKEDQNKRGHLIEMFQELAALLDARDGTRKAELVTDFLKEDGTTVNFPEDCSSRIEELQQGECVILVAGESSAGKSSVLNLLFGESILPTHNNACTSTITTVRYGKTRSARILFSDRSKSAVVISKLDEAGIKQLHDIVYMKGNEREEGHDIREVQLYLPLWFLESGLVLADTPGIGENEFLEKYLMTYIAENQILGFMYIIMSDAAGGVQEDRLCLLLKLIIEEQKKSKRALTFEPKAALFVCNRFDMIPAKDQQMVKDHILGKLSGIWPEFEESHAVFFSTKAAQRDVDAHPDYINDEYKTLLEGLRELFVLAMERRVKASYKWIERVVFRITHYLKSTVRKLGMSERDRRDRTQKLQDKLTRLSNNAKDTLTAMRIELEGKMTQISIEVKKYLQTAQARYLCSAWKADEIPGGLPRESQGIEHWQWVKERVDNAFYARVCIFLEEWTLEELSIQDIEEDVVSQVRAKLGIIAEEIVGVESDMRSSGSISGSMGRRRSSILGISGRLSLLDQPIPQLPMFVNATSHSRRSGFWNERKDKKDAEKFKKNPEEWKRKRAEKLLEKLIQNKSKHGEKGPLQQMVMQLLQRPLDFIETVEEKIPTLIQANLNLLNNLEQTCALERKHSEIYEKMMHAVETLRTTLMHYGDGYIFVQDFKSHEIKILHDQPHDQGIMRSTLKVIEMLKHSSKNDYVVTYASRGLWTILHPGILLRDAEEKPISLKAYLPLSGVERTFQEVAKLRCLLHDDVPLAQFLGTHHLTGSSIPAFVYSDHLQSLQRYMLSCTDPRSRVPKLLSQISRGLNYIHSKGLVHMEMTSTTVTVKEDGEVRLSGACLPRYATLPPEPDTPISELVCLSPEVLNGDLYVTTSDVYGFGLLLFEIACGEKPFIEKRRYTMENFKRKLESSLMAMQTTACDCLAPNAVALLEGCLQVNEAKRSNMSRVMQLLDELGNSINLKYPNSVGQGLQTSVFRQIE